MKKFAYLLLLLPTLAFACPVLTGYFACLEPNGEGGKTLVNFHITTEGNVYTIKIEGVEDELKWVADGSVKIKVRSTGEGDIIHTTTMTCEDNRFALYDTQKLYHDLRSPNIKPEDKPTIAQSFVEYLSLNDEGNLVQEDHTASDSLYGETKNEDTITTCTRIKDEKNEN